MFSPVEDRPDVSSGVVRVRLLVRSGQVGVGCLNTAGTEFIDEAIVPARQEVVSVELVLPLPAEAGALVIRNASPDGGSEAEIHDIECFSLEQELDVDRAPGLSDPHPMAGWSRYYGSSGETAIERLRVGRFRGLTEPVVVRWTDGLSVRIVPGDQLSRALYVSGTYEPDTLSVLRALLRAGDVFLDAGANAGVISLVASRWVGPEGRVYSFEPSEREFNRLLDNLDRNQVTNVVPVRLAVSSRTGTASLRIAQSSHGGLNTLGGRFPYEDVRPESVEQVNTTTLDAYVQGAGIGRVAVMKLDVEGAEVAALEGAVRLLRDARPSLVVEVFSRSLEANGSNVDELERLLRTASYDVFTIDPAGRMHPIAGLGGADEQNVVALPRERSAAAGGSPPR
jgi:FkbM family methyltransferase